MVKKNHEVEAYTAPTFKVIELSLASCICGSEDNISEDDNNQGNIGGMPWDND